MMKKHIFRFGLLAGVLFILWMVIAFSTIDKTKAETGNGELIGYSVMFLSFGICMILALMMYRRENPEFSMGKGILLCLGISGVASVLYVAGWALTYNFIFPDFKEWWTLCLDKQFEKGMLNAKQLAQYKGMMVNYDNPVYFTLYTLVEVLPLGILLSLIIAPVFQLISRRKLRKA